MNREAFLSAIAVRLEGLPQADIERSLDFYREMIEDRVEDGMSEEEAVAATGTPEEAAARILEEAPLRTLVAARLKPQRSLRIWEIVLLVLGSPIWLPLLLTAAILVLTVYILLLTALFVFFVLVFSLAVSGAACVPSFLVLACTGRFFQGLFLLGTGLMCAGFAVLLLKPCLLAARGTVALARGSFRRVKRLFIRKGEIL